MARYVHACTHLTVSPNVFGPGGKANLIPDHVVGEVDVRVPPVRTWTPSTAPS